MIYQFTGLNFEQACCFNVDVGIISIVCSDTRMYITGVGAYFGAQCEKHGMLVRVAGDNIMMSPPFIMSHEQVEEVTSQQITFCSCHLIKLKKVFFKFGIWTRKKSQNFSYWIWLWRKTLLCSIILGSLQTSLLGTDLENFRVQNTYILLYIAKLSMRGQIKFRV